jgi:hypothetical protein
MNITATGTSKRFEKSLFNIPHMQIMAELRNTANMEISWGGINVAV